MGKLIFLYDDNHITLDGETEMTFTEDTLTKFAAMGWHTLAVEDGNDTAAIDAAIAAARAVTDKPSLISVRTIIGYGSPNKQGTSKAHGSPLGEEEVRLTKQALGWPTDEPFFIPHDALAHFREAVTNGANAESEWQKVFNGWREAYPDLAREWDNAFNNKLPEGWERDLPQFDDSKAIATRNASGEALNAIAKHVPTMIGGDADLAGSTKTLIKGAEHTGKGKPAARNVRFGVREHGMGAIVNGLALHGGIIKPYSATFLTFSDYMRGAVRLGALMDIPTVYVFTHDSIGLGEDGPTHQPVEHFMALRTIPNLYVFRPADANETVGAWRAAMTLKHPAALIFTRQGVPVLADNAEGIHEGVAHGGYILADTADKPEIILLATGSEVHIALEAFDRLVSEGIAARVVSLPCWELFEEQDEAYREQVLPTDVTARVSIEAGVTLGWERYVGSEGIAIGVNQFGASAPYERIYEEYGLTAERVIAAAKQLLD
ncbi:MAG: transketolase [Chloroflexi bacterium]|nr:MAG: transketolase [Chloroflexota bacterium]